MAKNLFLGKSHSAAYAKYRFTPPKQILETILKYLQEKISSPFVKAVDVGCGSGQSTLDLSAHFQHVLGTDVSENQLAEARNLAEGITNVNFSVAQAEELGLTESTVQLITASQCFHWLDADRFFAEAKRVLVPNGVLAVYSYSMPIIKTEDETLNKKLYDHHNQMCFGTLGSYWDSARKLVDERYSSVHLPFNETQRIEEICSVKESSLEDYGGYVTTWSSYRTYAKANGMEAAQQLLSTYLQGVMDILGSTQSREETPVKVFRQYVLLLGRNSSKIP